MPLEADTTDSSSAIQEKKKYFSVAEMGRLLGLKKTDRYYLLHKGLFTTIKAFGKTWVDVRSFEAWYEQQDRYRKVTGEKPGKKLRERSYSVRDIMDILEISEDTARYIIDKNRFNLIQTETCRRVSKEEFDSWYTSQNRYFNAKDREANQSVRTSTVSMPQMASALGVDRPTIYSILSDPRYSSIFEVKMLGEQKRITLKSFLVFLNRQDEYKLLEGAVGPAVDKSASEEDQDSFASKEKESIFPDSAYLTVKEASVLADVSRSMIIYWIDKRHIPYRKAGRYIRIPTRDFLTWLGSRKEAVS